jgi:hypothetical protein
LLWKRQLGTSEAEYAKSAATDGDGNAFVAGYASDVFGKSDSYDPWVAKYSAAGAIALEAATQNVKFDMAWGIATDSDGNVFIAGETQGSLGGPNQDYVDAWVAKYSAEGALRWKRQLGTADYDVGSGAATDSDGNVYIGGRTSGSLGGPNQGGFGDAWVAKYSAAGPLRWKRQLGTFEWDNLSGVATDGDGNVYIAGETRGPRGQHGKDYA